MPSLSAQKACNSRILLEIPIQHIKFIIIKLLLLRKRFFLRLRLSIKHNLLLEICVLSYSALALVFNLVAIYVFGVGFREIREGIQHFFEVCVDFLVGS